MNSSIILFLSISTLSFAMEKAVSTQEKLLQKQRSPISSWSKQLLKGEVPTIILESAEGQKFPIPKNAALHSETIKLVLQDLAPESHHFTIPFANISNPFMHYLTAFFWALHEHQNLMHKAQLDAIENTIKKADPFYAHIIDQYPIELLKISHYLDLKLLQQLISRTLAAQIIKKTTEKRFFAKSPKSIAQELFSSIEKNFNSQEAPHYIIEVARYYFLLTKQKKTLDMDPGIDYYFSLLSGTKYIAVARKNYGFSIQDYLDYKPYGDFDLLKSNIGRIWRGFGKDYYHVGQLISLEGLNNIPHVSMVKVLYFSDNPLHELPDNIFANLTQLEYLSLSHNKLDHLHHAIFSPLPHLETLSLSNNKLHKLDHDLFSQLHNLKDLLLSHNPLKQIDPKIFLNLTNLTSLWLDDCQLLNIEPGTFAHLYHLKYLHLSSNKLSHIDPQAFTHLEHLKRLSLEENNLSEENKKAIKDSLPTTVEINF